MEQPPNPSRYDPASHRDVDARKNRLRLLRRQSEAAFRRLMEDRDFRAFVWGQLERTHVFETSFDRCPHVMAFREGERNAGLVLLDRVNRLCPGRYRTMVAEAARERDGDEQQADEQQGDEHHGDEHHGDEELGNERHDD